MAGFPPLGLIGGGLGAIGGVMSGLTSLFSGNAQATALRNRGIQASMDAGVNSQLEIIKGNSAVGDAAARSAANGGGFTGSSTGQLANLAAQAMYNARTRIYTGRTEKQADDYQADVASAQGKMGLISGLIGGAGQAAAGGLRQSFMNQLGNPWPAAAGTPGGGGGGGGGGLAAFGLPDPETVPPY